MSVLAIAGPTACGKSALAIRLAEKLNGEIISVDSGAVYQDMNIGTATPTAEMQSKIPHHLINIVAPNDSYHVGRFIEDAKAAVTNIRRRGKTPILAGGTMMYFNALQTGLSTIPPISPTVTNMLAKKFELNGVTAMHKLLATVDAASATKLPPTDKQRIHRALSVYYTTKTPLSDWTKKIAPPPFRLRLLRLIPNDRHELKQRIMTRLRLMWATGLEEEAKHLLEHWQLAADALPLRMIGYKQAVCCLHGEYPQTTMIEKADIATYQLAKRQLTWLRQWQDLAVLDPFQKNATDKALRLLNNANKKPPS